MSDEITAVLQLVKSIDDRTARMETTQNGRLKDHEDRIGNIESDHKVVKAVAVWGARIAIFVLLVCGAGGAAKGSGVVDALTKMVGGE